MARETSDAVVVGAGINGIAAAAVLARAGWSVALVDAAPDIGGFIASGERTLPGYRSDTYSSWHPLFTTGPVYAAFGDRLHAHGLEYRNTDGPLTASIADDGVVSLAHRDPERTVAGFSEPADRDAYLGMLARFGNDAADIGAVFGSDLRSPDALASLLGLARSRGADAVEDHARDLVTSGRSWMRRTFAGRETDHIWAPWLLHAGLAPDAASGGFMVPVFAATLHLAGLPVVAGGAGRFVDAWHGVLDELGVTVHTGFEVERILVEDGRAAGVEGGGRTLRAGRAVLASVGPRALYGSLLPADGVPAAVADDARRFRAGRAAAQIHIALSAPVPWTDDRLSEVPLVHVSDGSSSTGIACAEAEAGLLPRRPTVVVGQQHVLDPSRVPEGTGQLWLQLQELPFRPSGDAAGEIDVSGGWSGPMGKAYLQRVLDRVEAHAPGLGDLVLATDLITPEDLLARNPNAIGGDPYAGSLELDQSYAWRPLRHAGNHTTPVPGLWHIGAATHPGAGLAGGSGFAAASQLGRG